MYLYLRGPDPHLLPATARAAVALSLTLIVQGFICTQLAMNMCRTDIERGICGVMGAVLAIQGAAWGLAVGLILFFMLFEGKKKASEQVAVGAADDKANQ